jgi:TP901 family phage tail tape measure protein
MGVRTVTVYVLGDGTGLARALNQATVQIDRFAANAEKQGGRFGSILGSNVTKGVVLGGAAIATALGVAAAAAVPFEASMRNVSTISDEVRTNFAGASEQVLELAKTVPQAATTLANGLYEIISSNFAGAEAFHVLEVSAKAASAGLTDTDTSARAITAALNAYGLSAASAGDVSDVLFQVVNKGVVTFHDLAQNLGDFVGIAAAAKVPLQDVGAAYAAITLAGIQAPEAATATNQLLTKLIKPTEELTKVYKALGYESGASALKQKGLQAVIQDIGRVTGGSSEQLVRMFDDVRAARGVLALLSADGANYQAAVDGIADSSKRTGATQRAFNEQMKSTQAQLTLFRNSAEAAGIAVGLKVLPPLNAFLGAAREAGGDVLPYLNAALHTVAPVFEQVWATAGNLASILVQLAQDAAPVAGALAAIAGVAVVGPLLAMLNVLRALTEFLADHVEIVELVAAVYLARLIPGLVAAGAAATVQAARTAYLTVTTAAYVVATNGAAAATARFATAAGAASIAMTAGLAAAIFLVIRGFSQWNDAQDQAKANADKVRASFNAYDTKAARAQLDGLRKTMEHTVEVGKQYEGVLGTLKAGASEVFGDGQVGKVAAEGEAAAKAYTELNAKLENTQANLTEVALETGLSNQALGVLAQRANIDLSGTFDSSADARRRLIGYVKDLKNEDAATAASIAANAQLDIEAMEKLEEAISGVVKAAKTAFERDTDVLGKYDPTGDAKKVADAQAALAKARRESTSGGTTSLRDEQRLARDRQSIADKEALMHAGRTKSYKSWLSQQQSLNRARQRLKDDEALIAARGSGGTGRSSAVEAAEQRLAEARAEQANNTLERRYRRSIDLSKSFIRDINGAIQRGLDPTVVAKLLAQGPERAEPVLQRLLADHSGNLIKMVNESETQIANLSGFVAEQARIAAIAMNAPTDQYTKDLKSAMAIAAAEAAAGGKATMDALVRSLKLPAGEIKRIAAAFGIDISTAIQSELDNRPVYVNAKGRAAPTAGNASGSKFQKPRAEGGPIDWGAFGRDQVPVLVTRREFVQPTASVDYYGMPFMEAVRTRTLPKFWDGGSPDGRPISSVLNMAGPRLVPVPIPVASRSSTDNSQTYNIEKVVVGRLSDVPSASSGGRTYSPTKGVS